MSDEIESIDRVIDPNHSEPEPRIKCPKCGSRELWVPNTWWETMMCYNKYTESDGDIHDHNPNIMNLNYKCRMCGAEFTVEDYHYCWCGWAGGEPKIIFESEYQNE